MPVAKVQAVAEHRESCRAKSLRLRPLENRIFDQACKALNNMERTHLTQQAVIHEAACLALSANVREQPPPALPAEAWVNRPKRVAADQPATSSPNPTVIDLST
jgi:hypothetical protein